MRDEADNGITIFEIDDLPNMGAGVRGFLYGFTLYRGVMIQWDRDQDERVVTFINELPAMVRCQLAIVQEHEGSIGCVWYTHVPCGYGVGEVVEVGGDFWVVEKSITKQRC